MAEATGQTTLVRKILWGVLPVVLLSLGGVGLSNYIVASQKVTEGIEGQVHSLAGQLSANLGFFFEQNRHDIESLAEIHSLKEYFTNADYGSDFDHEAGVNLLEVEEYCHRFIQREGIYDSVLFFDTHQKLITGVRAGSAAELAQRTTQAAASGQTLTLNKQGVIVVTGANYRQLQLVEQQGTHLWASPIQHAAAEPRDAGETWINYGMPVVDNTGARAGVVVLTCNLADAVNVLKLAHLGDRGGAYIVDQAGQAILGDPSHSNDVIHASARIQNLPDIPWSVKVEADRAYFLLPLVRLRNLSLSLLGLVALLAPVFLAMVVRRSTHPIVGLVAGTHKLAAGDLDYRFPIPPIRELGVLAVSFNDMAEKLKRRDSDLRARIRQLTSLRNMESTVIQRLDDETILRTCLNAVGFGLGFDRTGLYWVDEHEQSVVGRYMHQAGAADPREEDFRGRRIPLGSSDVLTRVMQTREAVLIKDGAAFDKLNPEGDAKVRPREFVIAPICGKDRVFGVITADNLHSGEPLEEADREGLMLFAGATGLALENTGLFERLSVSEARHRLVLDNSPVAILGLAPDYTISTWNRGAEVMFGYSAAEALGKPLADLFPGKEEDYVKLVEAVAAQGGVRDYAIAGAAKSAQPLDLSLSWGGSRPDGAAEEEWAVVIRDMTEAKKMQRQLIFSEKLSAVGQLISGIAHELNNPLQAVVGYADMLKTPRPDGQMPTRELKYISDNATRCRKIIDNLLLFVRQGEVRKTTIKLQDVVNASLELLHHKVRKVAGLQIDCDLPDEPLYVKANFQQIEQVIVNIVNNACDAMEAWEGPRKLRIGVVPGATHVGVSLADTGPGIPASVCAKIFEPFFTTKPEGRGTGLGLPVCRQIVNEHGGELRVTTEVGAGTTFSFELALAQPEAPVVSDAPPEGDHAPEETVQAGGSVLLVEDELAIRELLEQVLVIAGYKVEIAESLETACTKAAAGVFDIVVSDVQLDDGTGVELFTRWPSLGGQTRPPFLFLSGDILAGAIGPAANEDDVYTLQKPVDLKEMCATVAMIIAKHHPQAA